MELHTTSKKYHTITFGCQMNENDSERLAGQLRSLGYESTDHKEQADLILINTCCVRESAEKKIYGKIGEMKRLKQENPNLIIGIAGCMAQKDKDKLFKKAPHVDLVMGTHNTHRLTELLQELESSRQKVLAVWEQAEKLAPDVPTIRKSTISAYVPIMYGCNNFCTYCIVPYVRGRERSRPAEDIVEEIKQLGADGFKEITLLGQNVNSYGNDTEGCNFAGLLEKIDTIDTIARVRYMTSHPRDMSEQVVAVVAGSKRVCHQFHLPIQSGSDEILQRMNRGYDTASYRQLVASIRKKMLHASLTTDIIVGFPGETEELFQETLELLQEIRFDMAYTFLYSQRSGTPAATMTDQIPLAVKKDRLKRLMDIQNVISLEINKELEGQIVEVLVEGPSKNDPDRLMGRTQSNKIVIWDQEGSEKVGDLRQVKIIQAQTWLLKGQLA